MSDPIKEAFSKVKSDIDFLKSELAQLKTTLEELMRTLNKRDEVTPTFQHIIPTHPTDETPLNPVKSPNMEVSIGNRGVPTHQPTIQPTNQHIFQRIGNEGVTLPNPTREERLTHLSKLAEILNSLDDVKKEVRIKFKQLTDQEMAVFEAIYLLEDRGFIVDYNLLAEHLSLTEISIRDYVRKIITKGIPLIKVKQDAKRISISVDKSLKQIASLQVISQLRSL